MKIEGFIEEDEYGCLCILYNIEGKPYVRREYIIENISNEFQIGDKIFITYYLSDKKITEEEAKEYLILSNAGAVITDLNFILDAYSEYTIVDYNETFIVDGHDLYSELYENQGKYLILNIEKV